MNMSIANRILVALLIFSFVLTRFRVNTGIIMLEPWLGAFLLCFFFWYLSVCVHGSFSFRVGSLGWAGILIALSSFLSGFLALDQLLWFKRTMRILVLFGMYLFLVNYIRSFRDFVVLLRTGLLACAFASLVLLIQFINKLKHDASLVNDWGLAGTFVNSNEASTYMAMFVVLAAVFYFVGAQHYLFRKPIFILVTAMSFLGIIMCRSRSGLLSCVFVLMLFFFRKMSFVRVVTVALLILALVWNQPVTQFAFSRILATFELIENDTYTQYVQKSTTIRIYLTQLYWEAIKTRPILGLGAGGSHYMKRLNLDIPNIETIGPKTAEHYVGASSHNGFLNWWAETGTVGFIAFMASLGYSVLALWRCIRSRPPSMWLKAVLLGTLGALIVFILANLTQDFGVAEPRFWLLLAMTSIALRLYEEEKSA